MRWRNSRQSSNVEDRRGQGVRRGTRVGGGLSLIIIVVVVLLGGDPTQVLQLLGGSTGQSQGLPGSSTQRSAPVNDEASQFLRAVLGMTEDVWSEIFAASDARYAPPTMVLFTDAVESACGMNSSATGPFYCPPDQKLYLDIGFFDELSRMGGPGDFAQAYVIGHEVGHHIQNLTGTARMVQELKGTSRNQADANRMQVLMELQADCYAGVWAYHANRKERVLEPGDVEEGMAAAAAIGDDRLLRRAGRAVSPDSFTHGSSTQRQKWLATGLRTGDYNACDTFSDAGILTR